MSEPDWLDPACDHLRPILVAELADGNSFLHAPAEWNVHLTFWLCGYRLEGPRPRAAAVRYVYDPDPRNGWIDYYACRTHSQTDFRQPMSLSAGRVMMPWEIDEDLHRDLLGRYPAQRERDASWGGVRGMMGRVVQPHGARREAEINEREAGDVTTRRPGVRGRRHLMGVAAGLAALAPVYYLTEAGAKALRAGAAAAGPAPAALGYFAAVAVLVTVLAAWPAAGLACGLPLASAGVLFALDPGTALSVVATLPPSAVPWDGLPRAELAEPPGTLAGLTGLYTLIGVVLVLSALLPARLRSILGG